MEINGFKTTGFFMAQNKQEQKASEKTKGGQEQKNAGKAREGLNQPVIGKRKFVFTNASEIGKMLSSGKMEVDGVSIELSEESKQALEDAKEKLIADREAETDRYIAELNSYVAKQQGEAYEDMAEDMAKAMETARRIARGDIVPAKDEQKLMEYDADLYKMAKNAAMIHQMEKRRKQKSLYEEEEEREYTDPMEETTPMQKFGVEVEVSAGEGQAPVVENVSEGQLESLG